MPARDRMRLPAEELFPGDRRDRHPGTHFADEIGAAGRPSRRSRQRRDEPHVDEDLGCSAFGIDLPFVHR